MKLTVLERLTLLNTLPKEGDYTTLKIIRKLQDDLSFSEDEHKILQFQQEGEMLKWNPLDDKEVAIGEKATDAIKSALKRLDETKQLRIDQVELYERFIEGDL